MGYDRYDVDVYVYQYSYTVVISTFFHPSEKSIVPYSNIHVLKFETSLKGYGT
jgi:hypothetical protein